MYGADLAVLVIPFLDGSSNRVEAGTDLGDSNVMVHLVACDDSNVLVHLVAYDDSNVLVHLVACADSNVLVHLVAMFCFTW